LLMHTEKGSASAWISVSISLGRYFHSIVFVYPQGESVRWLT
jgi:hypothetical protein